MTNKRRKFVQNSILVMAGTLIGFVLAEVLVRSTLDIYECDAELGWTYSPKMRGVKLSRAGEFFNIVKFNSLGFRDTEHSLEKGDQEFRILFLGDSFTGGLQVPFDARFTTRLETQLNNDSRDRGRVEIINAGIDGYGTAQQLLLFNDRAARFQSDLTILAIYLYTDLSDNSSSAGHQNHHLAFDCGRPYFVPGDSGLIRIQKKLDKNTIRPRLSDKIFG